MSTFLRFISEEAFDVQNKRNQLKIKGNKGLQVKTIDDVLGISKLKCTDCG